MGGGNGELGHWLPFFQNPCRIAFVRFGERASSDACLSCSGDWRGSAVIWHSMESWIPAVWKARWSTWRHANKRHKSFYLPSENRLVVILIKDNCIIFFLRAWIGQIGNLTWQTSKLHLNIRERDNMQRWWSNVLRDILSTSVRLRNLSCHFLHPSLLCFRLIRKHGSLRE